MAWLRVLVAVLMLPLLAVPGFSQQPGEAARIALVIANEAYPEAPIAGAVVAVPQVWPATLPPKDCCCR